MKIACHAGHNTAGLKGCGAVGILNESIVARAINSALVKELKLNPSNIVFNTTIENASSAKAVLAKLKKTINSLRVNLSVSVHLNMAAQDYEGNGKTTGVEVCVFSESSKCLDQARNICAELSLLGFKNRGVKFRPELAVLKGTNCPSLLVECFFLDDKDDTELYKKIGSTGIAVAIAKGIMK